MAVNVAKGKKRGISVRRRSFKAKDFAKLSQNERLFFVRLAHAYNDLRHIQQLVVKAIGATKKYQGVEREIASHQMLYGLRQWYAALNEAWKIVRSGWGAEGLGRKLYPKLTIGKEPYDFLNRYFSQKNLVRSIRDRFAYHYQSDYLERLLAELNPNDEYHFVTTEFSGNVFYSLAENIQNLALIAAAGEALGFTERTSWTEEIARQAIRRLYDEVCRVSGKFNDLCNDVLPLLIKQCGLRSSTFTSFAVSDLETCDSVIFVDEEAVIRRHRCERNH